MMNYAHVYTLFLLFVFHSSCGQNQTSSLRDNTSLGYSESQLKEAVTNRAPISMVRNVRLARNGDILIASYLAVFRYDGSSFTNLTGKIISPRFSSFWDVLEDRNGNLWFASRDSGVYYYNGKSFQHFTTREGLANNLVMSIYEDKAGNIWLGASRYDGKSFRNFTTQDGFPSNSIRLLLEDKTGKLWFGAQGENMFVYDGKTFTVLKNKDGKAFKNVWSIIEDRKGSIWFGDVDGLWRYDGRTFTKVSQRGAYSIIQDKKGNIWTTGEAHSKWALSRYDANSLYTKNPTITEIKSQSVMLLGILEDMKGNIWFGSGDGVYRYDGQTITNFRKKEGQK